MSLIDIYAQQFLEEVPPEIDPPHEFTVEEVKAGLNFYDDLKEQVYCDIAIKATDLFNA
jgi:ASC-1-like (ASCH) protein